MAPHRPLLHTVGPAAEMSTVIYFLLMIIIKREVSDENQELQTTFLKMRKMQQSLLFHKA